MHFWLGITAWRCCFNQITVQFTVENQDAPSYGDSCHSGNLMKKVCKQVTVYVRKTEISTQPDESLEYRSWHLSKGEAKCWSSYDDTNML